MTIRVTITNSDAGEERIIETNLIRPDFSSIHADSVNAYKQQLKGGESIDLWVHSNQAIFIKEIKNG